MWDNFNCTFPRKGEKHQRKSFISYSLCLEGILEVRLHLLLTIVSTIVNAIAWTVTWLFYIESIGMVITLAEMGVMGYLHLRLVELLWLRLCEQLWSFGWRVVQKYRKNGFTTHLCDRCSLFTPKKRIAIIRAIAIAKVQLIADVNGPLKT